MNNSISALVRLLFSGGDDVGQEYYDLVKLARCTTNFNIVYYFNMNMMETVAMHIRDYLSDIIFSTNILEKDFTDEEDINSYCSYVISMDYNPSPLIIGLFDFCFLAFTNNLETLNIYANIPHNKIVGGIRLVPSRISLENMVDEISNSLMNNGYYSIPNSSSLSMLQYVDLILYRLISNLAVVRNKIWYVLNNNDMSDLNRTKLIGFCRMAHSLECEIIRRNSSELVINNK